MRRDYDALVEFLLDEVGDGVRMVVAFDEGSYEFHHGEAWFEEFLAERDARSPDEMHENAWSLLRMNEVAGRIYENEIRSRIWVTEAGTGCFLLPDGREGAFVWFAPDVDLSVPSIVDRCLERIE